SAVKVSRHPEVQGWNILPPPAERPSPPKRRYSAIYAQPQRACQTFFDVELAGPTLPPPWQPTRPRLFLAPRHQDSPITWASSMEGRSIVSITFARPGGG
ncbi:unnamed protein product, partial [Ectocarpus sp. 8 AP-2014]